MSWTYNQNLSSDLDKVRFEIQDTDTADQLFSNEEINATLTLQGSVGGAVLKLAKKLMVKFARFVDTSVGRVSESASQRYAAYKEIVDRFEQEEAALCMPSFGGTVISNNEALDSDPTLVQPETKVGGTDNTRNVSTFGGGGGQ